MARRSVLFAPGDQPDVLRKATGTGADVVVFDMEDAVAPGAKETARESIRAVLDDGTDGESEICVRVNPVSDGARTDAEAIAAAAMPPDSVMLPKVTGAAAVPSLGAVLTEDGLDLPILALLESAAGVLAAPAIAAADRTDAICFGAEDLAADIGARRTAEGTEVLYARERTVLAAAAADIDAIDTLHTDFEDDEGLRADTEFALDLGFDGKLAIHPRQIEIINEAFTPADDRIEWAEQVLAAQAGAETVDRGVFQVDGEMIDAPLVAQAEQILERARAAGKGPG